MKKFFKNNYSYLIYILYFAGIIIFKTHEKAITTTIKNSSLLQPIVDFELFFVCFLLCTSLVLGMLAYSRKNFIEGRQLVVIPAVITRYFFIISKRFSVCYSKHCLEITKSAWASAWDWLAILLIAITFTVWLNRKNPKKLILITFMWLVDIIILLLAMYWL